MNENGSRQGLIPGVSWQVGYHHPTKKDCTINLVFINDG